MRHITKTVCNDYVDYLKRCKPQNWDAVDPQMKRDVRAHILNNDQSGISAYTERRVSLDSSHVDHFVKQKFLSNHETLDYDNLFADEHAGSENYGADFKDNSKSTPINELNDYQSLINPAKEDPHDYFGYSADGAMIPLAGLKPEAHKKADYTIQAFNLCHPTLVHERRELLHILRGCKGGEMTADDIIETLTAKPFMYPYPSFVEFMCNNYFDVL